MKTENRENNLEKGKVYLIGAGPGDPALLTCRAREILDNCDVVCYDKLVSQEILDTIPAHIEMREIGYRGYNKTHLDYGMHPEVIECAKQNKVVARLKTGDPCIFGRTTEECRDLNQHGIPFEIIPGISAALGAASYTGFPLTSGGIASSVTFISGHKHSKTMASLASHADGTLVLYMGSKHLAEHVEKLIDAGKAPNTAIAYIVNATCNDQQTIVGTLETIEHNVNQQLTSDGPAIIIVGDVVKQIQEFNPKEIL